jgi:TPR repeat protein
MCSKPINEKLLLSATGRRSRALQVALFAGFFALTGKSLTAADSLKEIALEYKDATASFLIAEKHYKGHGAEQDYRLALKWYIKAAEFGHVRSQLKLGEMYYYGIGTEKNSVIAVKWLEQPAEQGYSSAQYLLGLIYSKGGGPDITNREREALHWFKQAAEDYHAEAAYHAGRMYYYGIGEQANVEQAKSYLKLAEEYGSSDARQLLTSIAREQEKTTTVKPDLTEKPSPQKAIPIPQQATPVAPVIDLQQLARNGDTSAQFELAEIYFYGRGNQQFDIQAALKWYESAARNGHAASQYQLGMFYYSGEIVTKDLEQARNWFEKAAAQNHREAKTQVALLNSELKKQQLSETEILIAQARQGEKDAQYQLGLLYLNGEPTLNGEKAGADTTIIQNDQVALKWFIAAGIQDHIDAQFQAGMIYFDPEAEDNAQAEQWLSKAASNRHLDAQYYLGYLYERLGRIDQAVVWLDRAAERNHESALDLLLTLYLDNRLSFIEKNKIIQWLEKAGKKGYIEAQYRLGEQYLQDFLEGNGGQEVIRKAHDWMFKAAMKDHILAQYRLGIMYQEGLGVSKHYTKSAGWLRRAAESGHVDAQFQLGEMYRLGRGLPKKETLAKKWYQQAADQGHMEARLRLSNSGRY